MRPPVDESAARVLRDSVPEFESHYLDLIDIYDEDLTPQVVFNELADFVTEQLHRGESDEVIERCSAALERVAIEHGVEGTELVAFCFLDQLPPFTLERIRCYLQPVTETILDRLEQDVLYEDDGETALLLSDRVSSVQARVPAEGE